MGPPGDGGLKGESDVALERLHRGQELLLPDLCFLPSWYPLASSSVSYYH